MLMCIAPVKWATTALSIVIRPSAFGRMVWMGLRCQEIITQYPFTVIDHNYSTFSVNMLYIVTLAIRNFAYLFTYLFNMLFQN